MSKATINNIVSDTTRRQVTGVLREILSDPDAGLALSRKAAIRLGKSAYSKKNGAVKTLRGVLNKY